MIRRARASLALVLLGGGLAGPGVLAQESGPSRDALDSLRRYLLVDCEVGEERPASSALLEHAGVLEPELGRVMLEGPDDAMLAQATASLERSWERLSAYLASGPLYELDDDTFQALAVVSHEAFLERGLRDFDLVVRGRAIEALAGLGTRSAQSRLRQALPIVPDAEVREMILGALKGQRLLERDQPAAQRGPSHRNPARPSNID